MSSYLHKAELVPILCRVSWRGMQLGKQSSHYYLYTARELVILRRSILNCIGIKTNPALLVGKLKVQGLKKLTFSNIILNSISIHNLVLGLPSELSGEFPLSTQVGAFCLRII